MQLARKDGATPLHEAAAAGHTEVAKVLMSVGATPDVTDMVSRPHSEPCLLCGQHSMHSVTHLSLSTTEAILSKLTSCIQAVLKSCIRYSVVLDTTCNLSFTCKHMTTC